MEDSAKTTAGMDGWEVVECGNLAADMHDVYRKIESNLMRPCDVRIGSKQLLFCLQPQATFLKKEAWCWAGNLTSRCQTCMHRIPRFAQLIGSGGKHFALCQEVAEANLDQIRAMRSRSATSKAATDYELVVIDEEFKNKYPVDVGPFTHVHFTFEQLSTPDVAAKLKGLLTYLNGSFENRFQRLVDDPASLQVIQGVLPRLVRPDHWKSVVSWAVKFVGRAGGRDWAELAAYEKYEIMVYAMLTGRSSGAVHLDMQQASNLVDFMDDAHNTQALCVMMDDRSDPEKYQVSQVAEMLRNKSVTSLCTVTLVWGVDGQPNKSDLDLHTKVKGTELFYGNKKVGNCKLDFDANASKVEKNPAENISLNEVGTFVFRVNNYNNRDSTDVPFEVVVRKPGVNQVYPGVWPRGRAKDDFLTVCTVIVTPEDLEDTHVEMSEAQQKKLAAKEAEWAQMFGEVKSIVANDRDMNVSVVNSCAPRGQSAPENFSPPVRSAQEVFSQMLAGKPTETAKPTLAEKCQLETLQGFIKYVTANKCCVEVDPRDFVPAYVTRLETKTNVLSTMYAISAYHRKNELPQQPRTDEQSTVRFDKSWGVSSRAVVHGFTQINNVWFMVLKGAHLPDDPCWPLGGGMYPTHLTAEAHHHRSKWTSFHSLVTPANPESGVPLIGSALVGFPTFQFILNGRQISLRG